MPRTLIILPLFIILVIASCHYGKDQTREVILSAGENAPELEKVIDHFIEDSTKLAAAYFLIKNMPGHTYLSGIELFDPAFDSAAKYFDVSNRHPASKAFSGRIRLSFLDGTDMQVARYEVATIIRNSYASLPEGVSYPWISPGGYQAHDRPVLSYVILSPSDNGPELIEDNILKPLNGMDGVEKAVAYGSQSNQWQVVYDMSKMEALQISESDLRNAFRNSNMRAPVGKASGDYNHGYERRFLLEAQQTEKINWLNLPIRNIDGKIVRLGEVATVTLQQREPDSYYRVNGLNTNVLTIYAKEGKNQLQLVKKLKQEVENIEASLPKGYSLILTSDPTDYVREEISNITWRTGLTLVILLVFVFAVSRSWKYLLIIVISLLVNLCVAAMFYYLLDIELHLYSIAGITVSFGLLIDNSIIMIDHVRLKHNRKVFLAILASTLTTIVALAVVFFLSEKLQANLLDFVKIVIVNLFVSLLVALFFIPALMQQMHFMKPPGLAGKRIRPKRRVVRFTTVYRRMILWLLRYRVAIYVVAILGFGLPVFLLPNRITPDNEQDRPNFWQQTYNKTLGSDFYNENIRDILNKTLGGSLRLFLDNFSARNYFTEKSETMLHVKVYMPQGAHIRQMNDVVTRLEGYLRQFKEIRHFQAGV